jgi:segregation and condensation protein B
MNESYVRNLIEAALLAAGGPLSVSELARIFDDHTRPSPQAVRAVLAQLSAEYAARGIELKETAGGFRIQVRRELAREISRLWPERSARYSRALLETLALIAYRQPITRAEIEAVRGVAVNPNIIRTVIERNWVRVVGHRDVPGHPELLGTTREFLDYFGLKSLDELPPLAQLQAMGDINLPLALEEAGAGGAGAGALGAGGEQPTAAEGEAAESDEAAEDDELSADGGSSAELVARPPDTGG